MFLENVRISLMSCFLP